MNALVKPAGQPAPAPAAARGGVVATSKRLVEAVLNLPSAFKSFVIGGSLLAMAQEGIGIIASIYGIAQFGLLAGILSQATELVFRIPGSLFGAKFVKRFDAKQIYMITTVLQGLMLLSLPPGAWVFGAASSVFLAQYLIVQMMRGVVYGASRGMAENQIMPRLVGQDARKIETAGFVYMLSVEAFALATAFGLSPAVRGLLGSTLAIGFFSALMLTSLIFFKKIEFIDEPGSAPASREQERPRTVGTEDTLPVREYIPYVQSSFLHFSFNGLFCGLFATYTWNNEFMADRSVGFYDGGSLGIALVAAVPALLASLGAVSSPPGHPYRGPAPGRPGEVSHGKKKGLFDRLSLKAWYGVAVLAAVGFLWSGYAGLTVLGLGTAAVLGAMTTVNRTKWIASYLSRLKPERHARVVAVLNSLGVVAALLPFLAISLGKVLGIAVMPVILAIVAALSIGLVVSWLATRQPKAEGEKN